MAATAFSLEPSPASNASPSYLWEVPGKPVIVHVALEVVDRLDREVVGSLRSLDVRGSEIGGLLLGSVQRSTPFEVFIESYDVVPSEYMRGPLYQLSPRELEKFEGALKRRVAEGRRIVGFFRSHTRKGLGLDTEDIAIFNRFFPKRYQVALLAKPFATKPSAGAIFIREGRSLRSEISYKEFPFRTSKAERRSDSVASLRGGERASATRASNLRARQPSALRRATVIPSESQGGVIVPLLQVPGLETTGSAAPAIAAETIAALALAPTASTMASELRPAPSPDRQTPPQRTAGDAGWAVSAALIGIVRAVKPICIVPSAKLAARLKAARPICIATLAKLATAARAARPVWIGAYGKPATVKAVWPLWTAGASATALVVSGLLFFPGLHHTKRPATTASKNASTLSFRVERSAGELLLTWNRDADVIHEAKHAVLAIADGERQQSVDLDQAQLRDGGIVYLPSNSEINFQLTVTGRNAWQTQSESLRVLRVSPWAAPEPPPPPPPKLDPNKRTRAANVLVRLSPKASKGPGAEPAKALTEAAPHAGDLAQSSALTTALDLPDAPGLTSGPQVQGVLTPGNMATPGENLMSLFQLLVTKPPDIPEPSVGGRASQAHHVKSAKALSDPPVLQNSAVAALKRWVYKPVFRLSPIHHSGTAGSADEAKPKRAHVGRPQYGPKAVTAGESQGQ